MRLFLALILFTQSVYGAAIWPNGSRLETFQNGFLFGNGQTIDSAASGFTFGNGAQFNGPFTLEQEATPSNPSAGFNKLYFKNDNNLYKLNDAGEEVGVSSVTAGGQQQSGAPFSEIRVPNQQVVRTSTGVGLLETGNKNLLLNSGFEHQTYTVGWTTSGTATYSAETSAPLSGLKSFKAVATAQTIDLLQDTTLYASARSGSQMFFRFPAKNTATGVTACVRKNGVKQTGSTDCLTLATDGVTRTYELAFLADGTSNGIEIDAASTTGTLIVDDVELSTESSAFVDVAQIGPWIDYGVIPLTAVTSNPTKGTTTADKVECRTNGQDYECRYRFANTGAGAAAGSGDYLIGLPTGVELNESFYTAYTGTLSGTSQDTNSAMDTSGGSVQNGANSGRSQAFYYGSNRFRLFLTAEFSSTGAWSSGYKAVTVAQHFFFTIKFRGKGLSNKVSTYSQFAVSDVSVENVFSAKIQNTGTASVVTENLDWVDTVTRSSAGVVAVTFKSGIFTVPPAITATIFDGVADISTELTALSTSGVTFRTFNAAGTPLDYDVSLIAQKQGADYKAKNIITGSFQGIEKCADPYECTDTFSAEVESNGTVVRENIDWISGNCTNPSTGINICTLTSSMALTSKLVCTATPALQTGALSTTVRYEIGSSTTTALEFISLNASFTPVNEKKMIICQKQGVDFRPKTAVAGTFLDSVTAPNTVKVKTCYYAFGGASATLASPVNCTSGACVEVYDNCGTVTAPSRAAGGTYSDLTIASGTFANSTYLDCSCVGYGTTSTDVRDCHSYFVTPDQTWAANASGGAVLNLFTSTQTGTAADSYVSVRCEGIAP